LAQGIRKKKKKKKKKSWRHPLARVVGWVALEHHCLPSGDTSTKP
jgi:hypothetical protein